MSASILFVSGIDTDAGKTFATAFIASQLAREGRKTGILKLIQTGTGDSRYTEDETVYRRIAPDAIARTGVRLAYPASPKLAARMERRVLTLDGILQPVREMAAECDILLVEGAGGMEVPVLDGMTMADIAAREKWELVLVVCGRLGAVNHTILSLNAARMRGMAIRTVAFNKFGADETLENDLRDEVRLWLAANSPATETLDIPVLKFEGTTI
ncbi:MAG: dethiobiotin synthase [Kiritimatiellae bacterium]|nr:dethiobiotin synthase [Kiritimatiellia bacterium]